jgi:hypothetical protein
MLDAITDWLAKTGSAYPKRAKNAFWVAHLPAWLRAAARPRAASLSQGSDAHRARTRPPTKSSANATPGTSQAGDSCMRVVLSLYYLGGFSEPLPATAGGGSNEPSPRARHPLVTPLFLENRCITIPLMQRWATYARVSVGESPLETAVIKTCHPAYETKYNVATFIRCLRFTYTKRLISSPALADFQIAVGRKGQGRPAYLSMTPGKYGVPTHFDRAGKRGW